MSALASLKLVVAKRPMQLSPIVRRRQKLSDRLWEQIELAKAKADGGTFAPEKMRTVKNKETGESKTVSMPKRIKEWWFVADGGKLCVSVRYGAKVIEIAKGKTAVEIASNDKLVATLEVLRAAVDAGEMDAQIEAVSGALKAGFKK
jgi:hypothetical protein